MDCIVAVSEQPIVFVLLEHQAVPGRKLPLMSFSTIYMKAIYRTVQMIILNSQSKCFRLDAVRAHTAYK
jgi:hypothetical protein